MKTEYDTDTAFLYPITGRAGTPLFYTLMLRDRSQKSLATSGLADVFLQEIRISFHIPNPSPFVGNAAPPLDMEMNGLSYQRKK